MSGLEHLMVQAGDVELHVVQAGPRDGRHVMLLHGFPDMWQGWSRQIAALAEAGYRVTVPDQRGYATSSKPEGVDAYRLDRLVGDVRALADALDISRFSLVGHDWGGIVAWACGTALADRLDRLAILNAPHPEVLGPYARSHPVQALRSFYVGLFQIPAVPEAALRARDHALLVRALRGTAKPGSFSDGELRWYRAAWSKPGALTGMLNWYRALRLRPPYPARVEVPTLILWGAQDVALERGLAEKSLERCANGRLTFFEDATHWVQRDEAEAVNAALLDFLAR